MRLRQVAALAFADEMDKIAGELELPLNFVTAEDADFLLAQSFLGDMLKEGATRAVKEWQKAHAAGDTGTADTIAKGYGQAGLKPRQLRDVSIGGAEAGVDQMMGSAAHVQPGGVQQPEPMAPRRALDQRLDTMKSNKAQLGVEGRSPSASVKQSPEGRAALLRGTQPAAPAAGGAPNESGYIARKMYKPDSFISQAEFTPQHVQQKMEMTQAARALSPEAKAMVPDMYGHTTMGTGPTQRTMSYHEFVPGMQDLRGKNMGTDEKPIFSKMQQASKDIGDVKSKVLEPLKAQGMTMGDVTGERGTNWGNIARDAKGQAKVVDFLPSTQGKPMPASQSFAKYAPMPTLRHSEEGGGTVGDLRKEMFKPTMESRPASPEQVQMALRAHGAAQGTAPPAPAKPAYSAAPDPFKAPSPAQAAPTSSPVSGVARTAPRAGMAQAPTSIAPPSQPGAAPPAIPRPAPVPQMASAGTAAATPRARAAPAPAPQPTPAQAAPTAAPGIKPIGAAPVGPPARVPPHPMPHPMAMRPSLPTRPVLGGMR